MIRVALADDHAIVRGGLRALIDGEPDMCVVAETDDGARVLAMLGAQPTDVLVLDLSLPNLGGMEILRALKADFSRVRVCIFTMYPEDQLALYLLQEGASAYLSKNGQPEEILTAIRRIARGRRYLTEALTDLALEGGGMSPKAPHTRLTGREYQVFILLIEGRTVSDVARELDLSASTVSNHVAGIKDKLGASSINEIVRYAARIGLLSL